MPDDGEKCERLRFAPEKDKNTEYEKSLPPFCKQKAGRDFLC